MPRRRRLSAAAGTVASLVAFLAAAATFPLPASGPDGGPSLALRGGRIMTVTRGVLEDGILLILDGRIAAVGPSLAIPAGVEIIDIPDYVVTPGFIDAGTNLGAADPLASERDDDEATSPLTPQLNILDALNPADRLIPEARRFGTVYALCAPGRGNLLAGSSALVRLAGDDARAMALKAPAALHGSLGETPKLRYGPKNVYPSTRMGQAALLRQTLIETQEYLAARSAYAAKASAWAEKEARGDKPEGDRPVPPPHDARLASLVPVLEGERPLVLTANRLDDILTALRIADEFSLKLILNEGADAPKVKDRLAERGIPVLVRPRTAYRTTPETKDAAFEGAAALARAGIRIAFQTGSVLALGDLIPQAQRAIAHGLREEDALKALTLWPAEIFGVADVTGSIVKGKAADLVVFDRNPLRAPARVKLVIIGGRVVDRAD
ncbi:MAG: amidohydrolase family protein [Candidatus Aminicenantes bacterium]|nr:amidohydrolase family protein [Candidatus Aminicenantes bacterium]